ncbi:MAG: Hydrolase (HAD superfamily), YqeK [uncultured Rubrobacteraceae bacterium]|uniref:bis(5'-nucleosyl)-tetraphosphatase (symmetrical) n=1 Tax=uncultured Rubrobacteraceae bacterium TaxID=349277 RepID=A0A6J4S8R2_9ACTN|nr:MAG: Hydrolase (HAD superfamily), YqeK [uncultured Rubrobacteraceae bacterium]
MEDRERIYPAPDADNFARERLSAKRYGHTLRVAKTAEVLAHAHGLDPARARLAALLHDAARETPSEEFLGLAEDLGLSVGEPERESPKLLHGPVAAELARRELGVEDEGVLEAIRDHTTGRPGMSSLSLVLYVADKIEPARGYPSVDNLRRLARRDLRAAAAESLRRSIAHNEERGRPTHPASVEALGWLEEAEEGA